MLGLKVDLLGGRYVATHYNDRDVAEWPPHPARLFSALVAAWAEHEPDCDQGIEERAALQWLEAQVAPNIVADLILEDDPLGRRTVSDVFVPVNDTSSIRQPDTQREKVGEAERELLQAEGKALAKATKALSSAVEKLQKATASAVAKPTTFGVGPVAEALQMLPEARKKQARTFPCITPPNPWVEFWWPVVAPEQVAVALARLVGRVARLGHSSSLVSVRIQQKLEHEPQYRPDPDGEVTLRWVATGQTDRLVGYHQEHQQVEPRVMPGVFVSYRTGILRLAQTRHRPVFDARWVVLSRVAGPRLPITSVVGLTRQFNRALQSVLGDAVPEILSGHQPDGTRSERPHVAVVGLPHVASPHADGSILGLAIVLPREVSTEERRAVMAALAKLEEQEARVLLQLGTAGVWELERVGWERPRQKTLRAETWTGRAREWLTATPIALDTNPGDLHSEDVRKRYAAFAAAEASVSLSVERIGLPRPAHVEVSRSALLEGAAKPSRYPRYPVKQVRPQKVLVHARLLFEEAVDGPLILGAGRYQGLGLCRPIHERVLSAKESS